MAASETSGARGVFSAPLREFLRSPSPENTLFDHVEAAVEAAVKGAAEGRRSRLRGELPVAGAEGRALRLLLLGYSGTGNVGADIRVAEMVRQIRHLFGRERIDFQLLAVGGHGLAAEAPGVVVSQGDGYLPEMLARRVAAADGVVACEGSMFKSGFSNMLALMLTGGLALASAEHKLALAWAAEAGTMDGRLRKFVEQHCAEALAIVRNPPSEQILAGLGLRTFLGADPAWTYRPESAGRAEELLRSAGWDGRAPVICVCPANPFWYPVRPDVARTQELAKTGAHREDHFASVLFHERSEETVRQYQHYLDQLAAAVREQAARSHGFPVVIGMEKLDIKACEDLAGRFPRGAPVLMSGTLSAGEIVAVLRRADLLVSSRYHAVLTATPGLTPTVGVAGDERIPNLLAELGRPDLSVPAGAPDLGDRLATAIAAATSDADGLRRAQGLLVAGQIRRVGLGGRRAAAEVERVYPGFHDPAPDAGWDRFIPPVDPVVEELLERHG